MGYGFSSLEEPVLRSGRGGQVLINLEFKVDFVSWEQEDNRITLIIK